MRLDPRPGCRTGSAVAVDHALATRDAHVDDVAGDLDGVREDAVDVVLAGGAGVRALPRAGGLKGELDTT